MLGQIMISRWENLEGEDRSEVKWQSSKRALALSGRRELHIQMKYFPILGVLSHVDVSTKVWTKVHVHQVVVGAFTLQLYKLI